MQPLQAGSGVPVASRTEQNANAVLRVGTSGYAYPEWTEAGFYPPGMTSARMLRLYATKFAAVELNYTWYQLPKAEAIERQRRHVPGGFVFAAKLTRTLTHETGTGWRDQARQYGEGIAPLVQARQLAAVLAQFPNEFARTQSNRRYLAALLEALAPLPLAVEFRHASWATERVFSELASRRVTLVAVDEPGLPGLFPALGRVTYPGLFYVRFHGRNRQGWHSGTMQRKFDYDYSDAELREWVARYLEPMARQSRQGLIFFNNHVRAQAAKNALTLLRLLRGLGLEAR